MAASPWRRATEAAGAVACVVAAAVVAAQWVDRGDATCTALYRVDRASYWFTRGCRGPMTVRLAVVVVLLAVAAVLALRAWRRG